MIEKLKCWEFKNCGRDISGKNTSDLGVCPASTNTALDGIHSGISAGRACWAIPGTMCMGKIHSNMSKKFMDCEKCSFYDHVRESEGDELIMTLDLLIKLNSGRHDNLVIHTVCSYTLEPIEDCMTLGKRSRDQACPYTLELATDCHNMISVKAPKKIRRLAMKSHHAVPTSCLDESLLRRPLSHDLFRSWGG
ncbi:MAG: hypothetical protein JSV21_07620 [Nitrospirota bacterium]|nr:MAG: hypothetical protein JSV21_07620 [Nitrospirota bacterium]